MIRGPIALCFCILFFSTTLVFAGETYKGTSPPTAQQVIDTFKKSPQYPKDITFIALAEGGEENEKHYFVFYTTESDNTEEFIPLFKLDSNEWAFYPRNSEKYIVIENIAE